MANRIVLDGMAALRNALRDMPRELVGEASGIVMDAAEAAKAAIVSDYPVDDGDLRRGVRLKADMTGTSAGVKVTSTAPHAHLVEYGSAVRKTGSGANRGRMPSRPVFVPNVVRKRREMRLKLIAMLKRNGFEVSGDG